MVLDILHYPNPILKKRSRDVDLFNEELHQFLDDMYDTMIAKDGVGLAAIQVGRDIRALLVNIPREDKQQYKEDLLEMINPEIIHKEGEIFFSEGCLSVPNFYEDVLRFEELEVRYQDRFGNPQTLQAQGYLAVAIQHEIDHLNGVLFVDRLSIIKRKKFEKEFKKIQKSKR
ncbi:peptide deformylase [Helicobacter kayseriensis]|uniref:peptide deformylase n=1 Tax=Helicobacter kayseriensis TaxID=2905877 RepID=UPI001E644C08|nr:peptide deformylase [Helicobacter kayseriensis]MCE3047737.1 peptide deformylase [Helicobacter kayseriensis]MCE3049112.1 peptide deformylase [Helicobacter kayseriensis]